MLGGTVIIDDPANGGSAAGAWLGVIADTPGLRAQCPELFTSHVSGGRPGLAGPGGTEDSSPTLSAPVPPATPWEALR